MRCCHVDLIMFHFREEISLMGELMISSNAHSGYLDLPVKEGPHYSTEGNKMDHFWVY